MAKTFTNEIPKNSIVIVINRGDKLTYIATKYFRETFEKFMKVASKEIANKFDLG